MKAKRCLCLSLYHFFLSLLVTCFSMYIVSRQLNGEVLLEGLNQVLGVINIILLSPSYWLYERLNGNYQWLLFAANSLVWGIALELLIARLHTRKQRHYFG
jgi:uncharacterized membrane protein